jgi:hypothetical protein
MPDVNSIPFRQANGNGHYESKQLPNDNTDFLAILGLPVSLGNVTSVTIPSRDGQLVQFWQTGGLTVKGSTAIGLVDLVDGVVTTKPTPAGDIVGTTAIQTLRNKTIENSSIVAPSGLTKSDVGLSNVDNTSDLAKPVSTATQLQLNLKESLANKNVANGYAGLDASGKVDVNQLPATVQGTVNYQGTWNATSNTPVIPAASASNRGWYYVVSVAGSASVSGVSSWGVGDWLVSNGTAWDKIDNTDAVASVAGKTGVVVLDRADVQLGNVDNTSDAQKNSAAATLTNKTINGASNSLTVRLDADVVNNLPIVNLNNGIGANPQTWWCGDGQWKAPTGAGDVVGPAGAIDGEIVLFQGATGKLIRRPVGTEIAAQVNPSIWGVRLRSYNAIGNPNFEIDQRLIGGGVVSPSNGVFLQDRWKIGKIGTMAINGGRVAGNVFVPGTNFAISGYNNLTILTTQQSSLAAGDLLFIFQTVEGSQMRELIGDVHSLSLLVKSNVAGLKFGVSLRDGGSPTRSLCKLCTITTANVWTLITLPNLPVWAAGGNWSTLSGVDGYSISITLAAGATYMAPANDSWQNGNYLGAVGQDNFCAKPTNSTFYVGFVQHEPGADCSTLMDCPFQPNYDDCLRYYQKTYDYGVKAGSASSGAGVILVTVPANSQAYAPCSFKRTMAKVPTLVGYSNSTGAANTVRDLLAAVDRTVSAPGFQGESAFGGFSVTTFNAGITQYAYHYTADTGW